MFYIKKIIVTLILILVISNNTFSQITNINIGTTPNDGTGDTLRSSFQKVNYNFNYLKSQVVTTNDSRAITLTNTANQFVGTVNATGGNVVTNLQSTLFLGQASTNGALGIWDNSSPGYDEIYPDGTGKLTSGAGFSGVFSGIFTGNGSNITSLNPANLIAGNLPSGVKSSAGNTLLDSATPIPSTNLVNTTGTFTPTGSNSVAVIAQANLPAGVVTNWSQQVSVFTTAHGITTLPADNLNQFWATAAQYGIAASNVVAAGAFAQAFNPTNSSTDLCGNSFSLTNARYVSRYGVWITNSQLVISNLPAMSNQLVVISYRNNSTMWNYTLNQGTYSGYYSGVPGGYPLFGMFDNSRSNGWEVYDDMIAESDPWLGGQTPRPRAYNPFNTVSNGIYSIYDGYTNNVNADNYSALSMPAWLTSLAATYDTFNNRRYVGDNITKNLAFGNSNGVVQMFMNGSQGYFGSYYTWDGNHHATGTMTPTFNPTNLVTMPLNTLIIGNYDPMGRGTNINYSFELQSYLVLNLPPTSNNIYAAEVMVDCLDPRTSEVFFVGDSEGDENYLGWRGTNSYPAIFQEENPDVKVYPFQVGGAALIPQSGNAGFLGSNYITQYVFGSPSHVPTVKDKKYAFEYYINDVNSSTVPASKVYTNYLWVDQNLVRPVGGRLYVASAIYGGTNLWNANNVTYRTNTTAYNSLLWQNRHNFSGGVVDFGSKFPAYDMDNFSLGIVTANDLHPSWTNGWMVSRDWAESWRNAFAGGLPQGNDSYCDNGTNLIFPNTGLNTVIYNNAVATNVVTLTLPWYSQPNQTITYVSQGGVTNFNLTSGVVGSAGTFFTGGLIAPTSLSANSMVTFKSLGHMGAWIRTQ